MKKRWFSLIMVVALSLVFGLQSMAAPAAFAAEPPAVDWSAYGRPLSADEMATVDGEWLCIVTGAISGAVGSFFEYIISDDTPTVEEAAEAVITGAVIGAVSGGLSGFVTGNTGFSWSGLGWGVWTSAHVGSLAGLADVVLDEIFDR